MKAQSIYPPGHVRVVAALDQWVQALERARARGSEGAAVVEIVFADGGVLAQGARFDVAEDGPLAWLRERLDHVALAGVQFLPAATEKTLEAFGRRLLEVSAAKGPPPDLAVAFVEVGVGLRLLDRRFEGVFSGAPNEAEAALQRTWAGLGPPLDAHGRVRLAETLRDDPEIKKRLALIRRHLGERGAGDDEGAMELLHRLTGVLPASAAEDVRRVRIVAGGLLDALEVRLQGTDPVVGLAAFFEDPALERRVAFLCTSLFRREGPTRTADETEATDARRLQGHERDDRITDDLAMFLFELDRLPPWSGAEVGAQGLESAPETFGVLLHLLVRQEHEKPYPGFDWALRSSLASAGEEEARVLRRVLDATVQRADDLTASAGVARTLTALKRVGHLRLARTCGFLASERVVAVFPREFIAWVDALDLDANSDRAELAHVIAAVGRNRIAAAGPELLTLDGLLDPARLERLLALPDPTLAPLVDLFHRQAGPAYRPHVLRWLRGLPADGPVTAPLHLVDDPMELPVEYVEVVLGRMVGREPAEPPDDLVVGLLARFVRVTAGRADRRSRRIQALRHLATFRHPDAAALLKALAYGRRWLVVPIEEKPVRLAAREELARKGAA